MSQKEGQDGAKSEGEGYLSEGQVEQQIKKHFVENPGLSQIVIGRGDGKVKVMPSSDESYEKKEYNIQQRELAVLAREQILQEKELILRESMLLASEKDQKTDKEHESTDSEGEKERENVYSKAHYFMTTPKQGKISQREKRRDRNNSDVSRSVIDHIENYMEKKFKELSTTNSRWLNQCSSNIETTVPPPNLKSQASVNNVGQPVDVGGSKQYRFLDWLKNHSGIRYNGNMPAFLRACSSFIDKAHPNMSATEYNMFVVNLLDPTARKWVYQILDQSISTMDPAELHKWLTLTFNNGATTLDRKRLFFTYNPALDSTVQTFGDLLAKLKSLADAANIEDREFYEKVRQCLPESAKTKLDITLGLSNIQNPTMKDIFLALAEQGQEIALHLNKRKPALENKGQGHIITTNLVHTPPPQLPQAQALHVPQGSDQMFPQITQTAQVSTDSAPQIAHMLSPQQTIPQRTQVCTVADSNNSFVSNPNKGKSTGKNQPKNVNYMSQNAGYPVLNAKINEATKTFSSKQLKQGTCPNCFYYGHRVQECGFKLYPCKMCGGEDHVSPQCPVYPRIVPIYGFCSKCRNDRKIILHHPVEVCRGDEHDAILKQGGSKN